MLDLLASYKRHDALKISHTIANANVSVRLTNAKTGNNRFVSERDHVPSQLWLSNIQQSDDECYYYYRPLKLCSDIKLILFVYVVYNIL